MTTYNNYQIKPLTKENIKELKSFSDRWIGKDYYSESELDKAIDLSQSNGVCSSLGAFFQDELVGMRISYCPYEWQDSGITITPNKWDVPREKVAYFKSLFIAEDHQGTGLGKVLSLESKKSLVEAGAEAIVCHSWMESPHNSSQKYLLKMGFQEIKNHPNFWYDQDYECTRCLLNKCTCSAMEMIWYLRD